MTSERLAEPIVGATALISRRNPDVSRLLLVEAELCGLAVVVGAFVVVGDFVVAVTASGVSVAESSDIVAARAIGITKSPKTARIR